MKNAPTQSKPVSYLADSTVYIHKSVPDIYCMCVQKPDIYCCIRSSRDRLGFYAEAQNAPAPLFSFILAPVPAPAQ